MYNFEVIGVHETYIYLYMSYVESKYRLNAAQVKFVY